MQMSETAISTPLPVGTWVVDPKHSNVGFQVKHMGIATVRGHFKAYSGRLAVGADGRIVAGGRVEAASVDTNEPKRDNHLRSPDFFDVEHFPELSFTSTRIVATGADTFEVTGDFTMHGVTRPLTLQATVEGTGTDPWSGEERVALEVTGQLDRRDWEMRFNKGAGAGNALVSDRVKLLLDLSAVKQVA
jgi:polyisoprenoid-binding protein YceI